MSHDPLALVDADLRGVLGALPDLSGLNDATLAGLRVKLAGVPPVLGLTDAGVRVSQVELPMPAGTPPLPALLYVPEARATGRRPAVLDLHGGGYVAGTAQREDASMRELSAAIGCVALVPDYRLAPEWPYPAPLDDGMAALAWLHAHAAELQIDPARIAVRGVSAGGGLATALALRHRDEGGPPIAHLHLLYPMLDDRTGDHPYNGQYVWTASANRYGWAALLKGHDREAPSPYAVPGRASDVGRLPPTFLALGAIDLFANENLAFASRLIDAGVPVEVHVYPGAYHGFSLVTGSRSEQAFARDSLAALRRALVAA